VVDEHGELTAETKLSSEVTDIIAYLDARLMLYHCFCELDNRTRNLAHADTGFRG
jgi:hypothetical protein